MTHRPLLTIEVGNGYYEEPRTSYAWIPSSTRWARPADPVFHRLEQEQHTIEGIVVQRTCWRRFTTCHILASSRSWITGSPPDNDYDRADLGMEIPIRWAVQFARPCRRCWP
jgi:hypothetical protein